MIYLEKLFRLKENNTTPGREVIAGFTTFLTMSYIIFVTPQILSASGMSYSGVLTATVLVCALSSILMGLSANLSFGLAPGMTVSTPAALISMGEFNLPVNLFLTGLLNNLKGLGFEI